MQLTKVTIQKNSTIEYNSKELLFLAKSGQPYRGNLTIRFISQGETVNLLSFKKYITSLRSVTLNAEDIAYTIYEKINETIQSKNLGVVVNLTARGGIQQHICFGETFEPVLKTNIFQI